MKRTQIYLASPFFNNNELEYYKKVLKILRDKKLNVYAPKEKEISKENMSKEEWAKETFIKDANAICASKAVVMLYYGDYSDSGTAWECGYAFAIGTPVIVVHLHDGKSNCMINCGAHSHLKSLEELEKYDFEKLPRYSYFTGKILGIWDYRK